ncbi:MAG: hypothetical protein OQK82_06520 [Candidatus Pacearchaeota archaeon]|nr:hypothetical protein [Candidatus Pacearchaeota archaeon]
MEYTLCYDKNFNRREIRDYPSEIILDNSEITIGEAHIPDEAISKLHSFEEVYLIE